MKNLLILLMMFMMAQAWASELEIIDLKHRSAEELIPVVRPLLNQDEMVSGMNYQLILRASPRNIAQIKRLLESIDTVQRRLKISVMQDVDSETVARLMEVSGRIGGVRITSPRVADTGGVSVAQGRVNIISTRSLEDDKKTQQLQVLEGSRAFVKSGQSVPVAQRQLVQTPWGAQVVETTQYKDVASGFYVLPRLNGDNVTVEISTQNDAVAPNQAGYPVTRIQNTSSVVSGPLGTWLDIGGLNQQNNTDSSAIGQRGTTQSREQRTVLIKVEALN